MLETTEANIKLDQIETSLISDLERRDPQEAVALRKKIIETKKQRAGKVAELLLE